MLQSAFRAAKFLIQYCERTIRQKHTISNVNLRIFSHSKLIVTLFTPKEYKKTVFFGRQIHFQNHIKSNQKPIKRW